MIHYLSIYNSSYEENEMDGCTFYFNPILSQGSQGITVRNEGITQHWYSLPTSCNAMCHQEKS